MNKINSTVKQGAKKLVDAMVRQELYGWPPVCWGPAYQPERPMRPLANEPSAIEEKEESCT